MNYPISGAILLLLIGSTLSLCSSRQEEERPFHGITISVDPSVERYRVDPLVFGVGLMYWKESDAAMADGSIEQALEQLPANLLRFPGGTDSDGYLWDEHRLYDDARWPFVDGEQTMDTDEFMGLCKRIGATPIICCNTELAFFESPQAAVDLAADWVRYCNVEKDYNVKYWEIGNEPYFHTRFTPDEYADLYLQMAEAMKAVDPNIQIGAVGRWKAEYPGVKAMIDSSDWKEAQETEYRYETGQWELKDRLEAFRTIEDAPSWWRKVLEQAGSEINFMSFHWYYNLDQLRNMEQEIGELKSLSKQLTGRTLPLAVTEWNLHHYVQRFGMERAVAFAEAIGRMLDGGVEMATMWPLRCAGDHNRKALLDNQDTTRTANYYAMQQFARMAGMTRIESTANTYGVYHFACRDQQGKIYALLINPENDSQDVFLKAADRDAFHVEMISPAEASSVKSVKKEAFNSENAVICLPAHSIALAISK